MELSKCLNSRKVELDEVVDACKSTGSSENSHGSMTSGSTSIPKKSLGECLGS
jgi:hypothetical protein